MNIAAGSTKKTVLNSLLKEQAFSKIQLTLNIHDEGFLLKSSSSVFAPGKMNFTVSPWSFDGTTVEPQSGEVLFEGKGFDGRPLLGILSGNDKALKARAVFALSEAITEALKNGTNLPANGAGGILYREAKGKPELLFLPEKTFEFSAANASSENYASLQGVWLDKGFLSDNKSSYNKNRALSFLRSAVIYEALTGELPFPEINTEARQTDILDASYLPLKNKINGVSEKLSGLVSYALEFGSEDFSKTASSSGLSHKTEIKYADLDFPLDELKRELNLSDEGNVTDEEHKKTLSDEEFERQKQKFLSRKKSKTDRTRFVRRNTATLVVCIVILAATVFASRAIYKDNLSKPTTVSLSETETIEAFFTGLHNMDINLMSIVSKGPGVKNLIDSVSNLYVSSKMRSAYELSSGTLTPEFWFYRHEQLKEYYQYGITNFYIEKGGNLIEGDSRFDVPKRKQNPKPVSLKEDGSEAKEGDRVQKKIDFYLVHSEGPQSPICANHTTGNAVVVFHKNRWLVTEVNIVEDDQKEYSQESFSADYDKYMEETGDILQVQERLKEDYQWIPDLKAIRDARIQYETTAEKRAEGILY